MLAPDPISLKVRSTYRAYYSASHSIDSELSFSLTHAAFAASALLAVPIISATLE